MAREQLLEVESLNGPEYHAQEDVVKRVLGSMYQGGSFCFNMKELNADCEH
jgi:hypothetical protein